MSSCCARRKVTRGTRRDSCDAIQNASRHHSRSTTSHTPSFLTNDERTRLTPPIHSQHKVPCGVYETFKRSLTTFSLSMYVCATSCVSCRKGTYIIYISSRHLFIGSSPYALQCIQYSTFQQRTLTMTSPTSFFFPFPVSFAFFYLDSFICTGLPSQPHSR